MTWRRPASTRALLLASTAVVFGTPPVWAQQTPHADEPSHDVIVVVGSQILGSRAVDALPVIVVGRDEIDAIAPSSGDDLFRSIPQLGDVGFNTSRTIGAVNDARGDTASINLRALGTGNTLVLLNGRRMVNHPGTQAENLVPVVTVNANAIPVMGLDRIEVLLDGASAIYGADAVAGVVNTVLKKDFSGLITDLTYGQEEGVDAPELSASFEWGINSDEGATNLSITGSYFGRDPIFASERSFTSTSDLRQLLAPDWAGQSQFDNTATTSPWGGFDRVSAGNITVNGVAVTNAAGQFHLQPSTLTGCLAPLSASLCLASTSTRPAALKYDVDEGVSVQNGIDRFNLFAFFNHKFGEHLAFFGEAGGYLADSLSFRETAPLLSAAPIAIPKTNYWNPFGPAGSPNRVAITNAPVGGLDIQLVGYRPVDVGPRRIEVENLSTRLLAGLRGEFDGYDWESALLYTDADTEDVTRNAVSNTAFQQQLALSTPDAYNPFNGGSLSDVQHGDATPSSLAALDAIRISVYRRSKTSLASWDFKVSRPDLLKIWSGDVGVAAGVEFRRETYADNRDPRLDGTISFLDPITGVTSSDVMGTSPTNDTKGARNVASVFAEFAVPLVSPTMQVPLVQNLDLQLAARYESFDRFGDITKPKLALSWRPFDFLMFRSAWSQGFRAPNLQQLYETGLQRSNTRTDWVRCEADVRAARYASFTAAACTSGHALSVTSLRAGSLSLKPETSENATAGLVFESSFIPRRYGKITVTADWWRIKERDVVGIFGDDNQITYDYMLRTTGSSNPAVHRAAPTAQDVLDFQGTGLAPAGSILSVDDNYLNLFPRDVGGLDLSFYYDLAGTQLGDFNFRINGARLSKFFQDPSPEAQAILGARAAGAISSVITVPGAASQIRQFGRPEWRWSSSLTWRKGPWGAGWFASYVGSVEDNTIIRASDNAVWQIDSYLTQNLYVQYTLGNETDRPLRFRVGVRNLADEKPPLADTNFGYLGDLEEPAGRFFYGSIRKTF